MTVIRGEVLLAHGRQPRRSFAPTEKMAKVQEIPPGGGILTGNCFIPPDITPNGVVLGTDPAPSLNIPVGESQ